MMEGYLNENCEVKPKNSSEEALQRWRKLCGFVKNPKRRFRFTVNLAMRSCYVSYQSGEAEDCSFGFQSNYSIYPKRATKRLQTHGFDQICEDELGCIIEGHDVKKFRLHGGVNGIAEKLFYINH